MKQIIMACLSLLMLTACQQKIQQAQGNTPEEINTEGNTTTDSADNAMVEGYNVGDKYIDFALPNPAGSSISIGDYVSQNKYTLVDFWASWCGPCRAEMPTVVKAYTDYHSKGFEVVGVSLDENKEAWVKAFDQLKMSWPQMSDLRGWDCAGAKLYNVRSIPSNVLIDQQGKIVAKDLRGEDLLNKLAELLK